MSRRGENIYKRKDGRWEGRLMTGRAADGRPAYRYFYSKTYHGVKEKMWNSMEESTFSPQETAAALRYGDILDAWLRSKRLSVKESSYAKYHHSVERYIRPQLGRCTVQALTTQRVETHMQMLLRCGGRGGQGLAPKTVADIMGIVKDTLSFAAERGTALPCCLTRLSVRQEEPHTRVFSHEEQQRLTAFLLDGMDGSKLGVLLCLYTGMRIGEVCALRWENIPPQRRVLQIRQTVQRVQNTDPQAAARTRLLFSSPKSRCSLRDIPIPAALVPMINTQRRPDEAFVLTGEAGYCLEPRAMQHRFKRYLRLCGVADAGFHTLRHTFATRCVEMGFELKSLSEILGHANVSITLNRYVHASFALKSANMDRLTLGGANAV